MSKICLELQLVEDMVSGRPTSSLDFKKENITEKNVFVGSSRLILNSFKCDSISVTRPDLAIAVYLPPIRLGSTSKVGFSEFPEGSNSK